tara:strand:+ start:34 stop:558 length:525 start_codon:yes stop_codon:yes gene_type:complete
MKQIIFLALTFSLITACGGAFKPKKVDTREVPVNAEERARKNINEGRGTSLGDLVTGGRGGKTNYEFSTSNPMWRASLEILDFLPLSTVDYSGGLIITDWYSDTDPNESIKITVRFLDNQIRSENLKVIVHKKTCGVNNNCRINLLSQSKISQELQSTIIRKAALLDRKSKKKK